MIQNHPPLAERLSANAHMLAQTPKLPAPPKDTTFHFTTLTKSTGDSGVQDMLAARAAHGMAAEHVA